MFGWLKKSRAIKSGEQLGQTIAADVDEYIANVIAPRLAAGLEVFDGRLATVWDSPPHDPRTVANVERKIFEENLSSVRGEFRAMISIHTYKWDSVFDNIAGLRVVVDQLIEARLDDRMTNLRMLADKMVALTGGEIDRRVAQDPDHVAASQKWSPMQVIALGRST